MVSSGFLRRVVLTRATRRNNPEDTILYNELFMHRNHVGIYYLEACKWLMVTSSGTAPRRASPTEPHQIQLGAVPAGVPAAHRDVKPGTG
jgi:hypothetical protein